MRRALGFLVLVSLLLIPAIGFAATAASPVKAKPVVKPAVTPKVLAASTAPAKATAAGAGQLTQFRWASHIDAITGASSLRLVFDASGPVSVDSSVIATPTPRLVVTVKGATPGQLKNSVAFDGKIADNVNISADGQNTRITIETPLMVEDGDYKVFTLRQDPANNKPFRVVVDINKPVPPMVFNYTPGLQNKTIVIDPGHGGTDPGAVGPGKTTEKAVNLAISLKVKALLEKAGAKVVLTRTGDSDVYGPNASAVNELKARATVGNARKADLFLSVHANSFGNPTVGGTATYYYQKTPYDTMLARAIQANMAPAGGLQDRGVSAANFYVIKQTIMPAVLVETAFISNPDEEKLLNDPVFQQKIAQGIVQGMENFFAQAARKGGER